jgi:Sec-independent protein secretion pathway component TatC
MALGLAAAVSASTVLFLLGMAFAYFGVSHDIWLIQDCPAGVP